MSWTPSIVPERRRRPLPPEDATIDALTDAQRTFVAESCTRRAELELVGAASFVVVTRALVELGAAPAIVALSSRAITEELLHSEIYLHVASRYAGRRVDAPTMRAAPVPCFAAASEMQQHALHVVGMCSVNETMACEFLRVCVEGCVGPLLRAAVREILADEIDHGRIGWAWLASMSPTDPRRAEFGPWIGPLIETQWRGWQRQLDGLPTDALPEHGCPSGAAIADAGLGALRDLVLPGFAHLGFDTTDAAAWLHGTRVAVWHSGNP